MGNKVVSFANASTSGTNIRTYTYADISMEASLSSSVSSNIVDGKYLFAKKLDVDAVKGAVRNIFSWTPGERILEPEFGNTIRKYLYEGITEYNSEQIVNECKLLMSKWEPRAAIDRIFKKDSVEDTENNQIAIVMMWHVLGLPEQKYQTEVIF